MPVGTRATVKGVSHAQLEALAPEVVLGNTYHLELRPTAARIAHLGGLHGFTGWTGPWLTDSGGYQVFSLGTRQKLTEEGVTFRSHLDGAAVTLTPERAMAIQEDLGADIVMAFDECVGLPATTQRLQEAVDRTTRWAQRCVVAHTRGDQALFGIIQGGLDPELRMRSIEGITALNLPGYAIGGLAVGESAEELREAVAFAAPRLPDEKPRYLMGVGKPLDLLDAIAMGVDMFDCVLPTRNGRRGHLYTRDGVLRVGARIHQDDEAPVDASCGCPVCRTHSRAYLRHLFSTGEHLAVTLGSLHNLHFLIELTRTARAKIQAGTFAAWRTAFSTRYAAGEASWRAAHEADPTAARRSQEARAAQDAQGETPPGV